MSTIRPNISKKNKYWIHKHRYYELKHFCLQYNHWKKMILDLDAIRATSYDPTAVKNNGIFDPTSANALIRISYSKRMELIEQSAIEADEELYPYIFKAVTEGLSYTYLRTYMDIPCCRDVYYDRHRKFFWILSKKRD